jgi:transcriptional regulator
MYLPKHHEESDLAVLHALIKAHPLGAWVIQSEGELLVNHIPLLIDATRGKYGTLVGHVARANAAWKTLSTTSNSIVVFQGAESYISPSWYPGKHEHGKVVPTWNYAVVHAHGIPRATEDPNWLLTHLTQMTNERESKQALPWKVSDAPQDFIDQLMQAIVGIEIPIDKLVGKWKVHQHRSDAEKLGVVAGLQGRGDSQSEAMAALVQKHVAGVAKG